MNGFELGIWTTAWNFVRSDRHLPVNNEYGTWRIKGGRCWRHLLLTDRPFLLGPLLRMRIIDRFNRLCVDVAVFLSLVRLFIF